MDDMIIKSIRSQNNLGDLEIYFLNLRKHHMRLNPATCTFGLQLGKFLGYLINAEVLMEKI